ncbi:hypothetical protein BZA05DRAFT_197605 [Tricharina praecox]|uniref:uncharacterized protein n=1 Tax=Tricharina praecox TaxID=43433 RepID=UPI00221EDB4B|nr:uncharacterized protein BZA05DRAFT_197605 [Tricharina praecox]KAI5856297.1 hypothetical protein BZA05DRAFT_197605 [Tricharina praecox]
MTSPNPHLVIRSITPQISTLSVPFLRFNRIKFGGRATLLQLSSGSLAVFSPIPLTADVRAHINSLGGRVGYIIAPDMEHHMQLGAYKSAFPSALVIGPHGLREKRARQGDQDVPIDFEYARGNKELKLPEELAREVDVEYWDGHASKEIVLLHKPSRTLVQADLFFNLPAREQYSRSGEDASKGWPTRIAQHFMNTTPGHKGQQRFIWYALAKDKASFAASARKVAAWDFDRIIP